ncbi:hypothetical protein HDV00_007680, partial [Rhizophlyctis rosea]
MHAYGRSGRNGGGVFDKVLNRVMGGGISGEIGGMVGSGTSSEPFTFPDEESSDPYTHNSTIPAKKPTDSALRTPTTVVAAAAAELAAVKQAAAPTASANSHVVPLNAQPAQTMYYRMAKFPGLASMDLETDESIRPSASAHRVNRYPILGTGFNAVKSREGQDQEWGAFGVTVDGKEIGGTSDEGSPGNAGTANASQLPHFLSPRPSGNFAFAGGNELRESLDEGSSRERANGSTAPSMYSFQSRVGNGTNMRGWGTGDARAIYGGVGIDGGKELRKSLDVGSCERVNVSAVPSDRLFQSRTGNGTNTRKGISDDAGLSYGGVEGESWLESTAPDFNTGSGTSGQGWAPTSPSRNDASIETGDFPYDDVPTSTPSNAAPDSVPLPPPGSSSAASTPKANPTLSPYIFLFAGPCGRGSSAELQGEDLSGGGGVGYCEGVGSGDGGGSGSGNTGQNETSGRANDCSVEVLSPLAVVKVE